MLDSTWDRVVALGDIRLGPVNIKIKRCCDSLYSICSYMYVTYYLNLRLILFIIYLPEASGAHTRVFCYTVL